MARSRWLVLVGAVAVVVLAAGCSSGGGGDDGGGDTTYTLSVTLAGAGAGTVTSSPAGISCTSGTCTHDFPVDTSVTLTASPGAGSTFAGWDGPGCVGAAGPCIVTVNGPVAVTATFGTVPTVQHTLTVTLGGTGLGTVASAPAGISCGAGGDCSAQFTEGAEVVLSAAPALDGSTFASWGGACTGEVTATCTVTMSTDLAVTANFDPPAVKHRLSVTVTGPGSGSVTSVPTGINCSSGTCTYDFVEGTEVTLTATPAATGGAFFQGWSGACAGTGTCVLTMDGDLAATATFSTRQTLNITVVGDGTGTVTSDPPGISCTTGSTAGCSADFVTGTTVTLTGTPAAGSSFFGWSPTCDASPDPCVFDIGYTTSLTARFTAWTVRRPFPTNVKGVAALGGTLVAVGTGAFVTSTDGLAWTGHELRATDALRSVAADGTGTTAVAVGEGGLVLSTADAATWTQQASGTTLALSAVVHGEGLFAAVGDDGTIVTSPDGAVWTARTSGTPYDLLAVAYGAGTFVAVGYGGTILTSADGTTWAPAGGGLTTQYLTGVAYDAAFGFVAVGNAGAVLTSTDGTSWPTPGVTLPVGLSTAAGVAASGGVFVAIDSAHGIHRSIDGGATWTTYAEAEDLKGSAVTGIRAAGGAFYAMSDGGASRAVDGTGWIRVLTLGPNVYAMAYGGSTYVLVGHGAILTSPDGATWTMRYAGNSFLRATDMVSSVVYGNSRFIAVSGHGILSSTDGIDWTVVEAAPDPYGGLVAFAGGAGFAVTSASSSAAEVWTSPDGDTWTKQATAGIARPIYGLVYGASTFVAVGGSWLGSAIYTNTTPGTTAAWTPQSEPTNHVLGSLLFGNSIFAASDSQTGQDTITSANAVSWSGPNHADSWMGKLIAFGDGLFLSQALLTSSNGVNWTQMENRPPGVTYVYAGHLDGPAGWVVTDGRAFAVHP